MKPTKSPKPPSHLALATRKWWQEVVKNYVLEPHHIKLLTLAAESWDRVVAARLALAEHGMTFTDRFGQPRCRPEVAVERDSKISFARLLRELDLDAEPPTEARRATSIRRGY